MANTKVPVELSSTPSIVDNGNATAITIDSNENVGIGCSPDKLLHLAASSGATLRLESTTTGATTGDIFGAIEFETQDSNSAGVKGKIDSYSEGGVGNAALRFFTGNTTELGERIRIASDGGVGIGQTTPYVHSSYTSLSLGGTSGKRGLIQVKNENDSANGYLYAQSDAITLESVDTSIIRFVTNAAERVRIQTGGGISFNGDTAAANALDDYEEGTWTLSITSTGLAPNITIGNTTGSYTKIGRLVTATIYTSSMNIAGAGSGILKIGGLPFNSKSGNSFYAVPSFGNTDCFTYEAEGYIAGGGNFIIPKQVNSTANNTLQVGNPKYMMMTITYFTDA